MRRSRLALAVLFVALPAYAAAESPAPRPEAASVSLRRLAVLEFAGEEFDTSYLGAISDRVRSAIVDTAARRGLSVMTQENMDVLVGQGGERTPCQEGACEVETAQRLGASYVISGRLHKIEKTYSATLKLHDARQGVLLSAVTVDDESLKDLAVAVAEKARELIQVGIQLPGKRALPLAGLAVPLEGAALPPSETEEVVVAFASRPPGALVRVDGVTACQSTPCSARVTIGPHEAEMELMEHEVRTTVFQARRGGTLSVDLSPRFGLLNVKSSPPGVLLAVNGEEKGRAPLTALHVPPGLVLVSVIDPCFQPTSVQDQIVTGATLDVDVVARTREAKLRVVARNSNGDPVDGNVLVDDVVQGSTGKDLSVPLCARSASMAVDGETWSGPLKLNAGELNRVDATLMRKRIVEAEQPSTGRPGWIPWVGATGIAVWAGAGAAAIYFHNAAKGYAPGDPRTSGAVTTGQALMIASNVGAAMFLTAVIGWLVTN